MMITQIREIACERIFAQRIGGAYDAFRHVDSWIPAVSDFGLVLKA